MNDSTHNKQVAADEPALTVHDPSPEHDLASIVGERVERLIVRHLDGEITPAQQAELVQSLATDKNARALLNEYRLLDSLAKGALRADFANAKTAAAPRHVSGFRLAAASMLLTAAAVVAFSFLPDLWRSGPADSRSALAPGRSAPATAHRAAIHPPAPLTATPTYVDYREDDYIPRVRHRDVLRDVVGIRGDDPNVIFIFERNTRATRIEPIVGDF